MAKAGNLTYITRRDPTTEEYLPAEGKRKIFISYKKTDNKLSGIRDIAAKKILRMVDVAVWYDENLTPGVEYEDEIRKAISECDALVLLLTRDILESEFVWENEVKTAREQKKGIIPIAFDISRENFALAEQKLGEKIQIISWPKSSGEVGKLSEEDMQEAMRFDDAFQRALDNFVINAELAVRVEQFFASKKHELVAPKDLTDEQKFLMGFGYLRGVGIEADEQKGIEILDSVVHVYGSDAETKKLKGDATFELAKYYYNNLKDYEKSFAYAQIGAQLGNPDSMYGLGLMFDNGYGVEQNKAKAIEWYTKAADAGNVRAMHNLGWMYEKGKGVEQDYAKAFEWYTKAADAGDADAMHNLGLMYNKSKGVEQDYAKAFEWYTKAANAGHAGAMDKLGFMYVLGKGVEQDKAKAIEWFIKATDAGYSMAVFSLGLMYLIDDVVEQYKAKVVECLTKAADAGIAEAMYILGLMYNKSEGVEQDKAKAVEWYTKAADAGHAGAMFNLGEMYENGDGVKRDKAKAVEWYTKAADAGDKDAKERLQQISKENAIQSDPPESDDPTPAPESPAPARKKSPARWIVPVAILAALIAAAVGVQISGLFDILSYIASLLG